MPPKKNYFGTVVAAPDSYYSNAYLLNLQTIDPYVVRLTNEAHKKKKEDFTSSDVNQP